MQIGGTKRKEAKATQPMFVVQLDPNTNSFAKLIYIDSNVEVVWVGDPNAATQFTSKYAAKTRVRELADVPQTRCFKEV